MKNGAQDDVLTHTHTHTHTHTNVILIIINNVYIIGSKYAINAQIQCKSSKHKAESSSSAMTPTMTQTHKGSSMAHKLLTGS